MRTQRPTMMLHLGLHATSRRGLVTIPRSISTADRAPRTSASTFVRFAGIGLLFGLLAGVMDLYTQGLV
jgi:hypothetical protein